MKNKHPKRKMRRQWRVDPGSPQPVGSLFGYQMLVKSEYDDPYALHKWKTPGGILETNDPEAVFKARTAFSLDSIVNAVAVLSHQRERNYADFSEKLRRAGHEPSLTFLPFLLRRLVTKAIVARDLPDQCARQINEYWLLMAEEVLMDMAAVADRNLKDDQWSTHSMAMRTLQAQFHDQLSYAYYKRELWINRRTVERAMEIGLDLEQLYQASYGLGYSELAALSFAAHATAAGTVGATFNPATWNRHHVMTAPDECIEAFFNLCAVSYEAFQRYATDPAVAPADYESYALSPLVRYPLIIRSDGLAVAPMLRDILERPTRAFQVDVLKALDRCDPAKIGRFNQVHGETYQDYVKRSLQAAKGCGVVRRGDEVLPRGSKNCDYICQEDGATTLVEVKAVWTSLLTDITKERDQLRRAFAKDGGVADGLVQLNESARMIRTGRTQVPKNSLLNAILVLRGEQVMLNSPFVRDLLEEIIAERTGQQMIVKYHLMNDAGLAAVVRLLANSGSLARFLYDKRRDPLEQYEEFHFAAEARNPSLPPHPLDHLGNEALDNLTAEHFRLPNR